MPRSTSSFVPPNIFAEELASLFSGRRIVVAFGGWHGCGKSKTARRLKKKLSGSCILKLSRFILPSEVRQQRGLSGANAKSFDIERICAAVVALRRGERLDLPRYDHRAGRTVGSDPVKWGTGILILDDPIAVFDSFSDIVDFAIRFKPENEADSLGFAAYRDVKSRHYAIEDSSKENEAKAANVTRMLQNNSIAPQLTVKTRHIKREKDYLLLYRAEQHTKVANT